MRDERFFKARTSYRPFIRTADSATASQRRLISDPVASTIPALTPAFKGRLPGRVLPDKEGYVVARTTMAASGHTAR